MLLALLSSRSELPSSIFLKAEDDTAMGSTDAFLSSRLKYTRDKNGQEICLLEADGDQEVGVMMGWERGLSNSACRFHTPDTKAC
jgi:protein arginine N-methyltransferase 2